MLKFKYLCDGIFLVDSHIYTSFNDIEEAVRKLMFDIDPEICYDFIRFNPKHFNRHIPSQYEKAYYCAIRNFVNLDETVYFLQIVSEEYKGIFPLILETYINDKKGFEIKYER